MPMPRAANSKTHHSHAAAVAHHGHNPNGVHGAHLNISQLRADGAAALKAFEDGEYALLDHFEQTLADGTELYVVHRRPIK